MANLEQLSTEYRAERPRYDAFTARLNGLIRIILEAAGIDVLAIDPRTKTLESFDAKIRREDKTGKYARLSDVTDLSGIRVIAYLQEDCDRICEIVSKNFRIDQKNSTIKEDELEPDQFGYLSTHYVVDLSASRLRLPEFAAFKGMKAEIQVRTILQHSWASIDWKFRYKNDQEAPKPLRRRLFRISALLEAADNEFSNVRTELNKLRRNYSQSISKGQLDIGLNTESIKTFMEESSTALALFEAASKAGIKLVEATNERIYSITVTACDEMGINSLNQLDSRLKSFLPEAEQFFQFALERFQVSGHDESKLNYPAALFYSLLRFCSLKDLKENENLRPVSPAYQDILPGYIRKYGKAKRGRK